MRGREYKKLRVRTITHTVVGPSGLGRAQIKFRGGMEDYPSFQPAMTHHPQIAHFDDHNQPPFACHNAHLTSTDSSSSSAIMHQILNKATFEQSDFWSTCYEARRRCHFLIHSEDHHLTQMLSPKAEFGCRSSACLVLAERHIRRRPASARSEDVTPLADSALAE